MNGMINREKTMLGNWTKHSGATRRAWLCVVAGVLAGCSTAAPTLPAPGADPLAGKKAALRDLGFTEAESGWEMNLSGQVAFAINDASLSPDALSTIARVATTLREIGVSRLTVDGHTDNQGGKALNQDLSERRAHSVAQAFAEQGFQLASITRRGFGYSRPVADNQTEAGRQQNRRVTIIVPSL